MRILFLNQYFPPDPAPTGILLRELADSFDTNGHIVDFVAARQDYRIGQHKRGRLWRELKALANMLIDGIAKPRVDLVISASSPPCLLIVAVLIAIRHRALSIHWAMDLYPEIAVALNEVRAGFAVSILQYMMGWCYRSCAGVIALDEDMAIHLERYGIRAQIIRPWVFKSLLDSMQANLPSQNSRDFLNWTWIYSGNLGKAHEWKALLEAQALLEKAEAEVYLVFQGGGPSWDLAQARAKELGLKCCEWRPYASETELGESLLRCQCCVVTQLPVTLGLLWPSKLGFVLTLPRPLLWIGPLDGAIARQLGKYPHAGLFAPDQIDEIADWLLNTSRLDRTIAGSYSLDAQAHRLQSIQSWQALIKSLEVPLHGEN